jgi:hypothetical protein
VTTPEELTVLAEGRTDDPEQRLVDGADRLVEQRGRGAITGNRFFLLAVAGALMTLGLSAIIVGWLGAARATIVEKQIPYLISGGLLGVAVATIGALTFFSHWFVTGIREARANEAARRHDHAELVDAVLHLADVLAQREEGGNGAARSTRPERSVRRTSRG